jgi:large subunit ribosomal protein L23
MWNVYGIHCRGVRSYIQMQKIRQDKPGEKRPKARKWFRPRSVKKMLIEMERPFVWPEVPDLDKYVALLPCLFVWLVGWNSGEER